MEPDSYNRTKSLQLRLATSLAVLAVLIATFPYFSRYYTIYASQVLDRPIQSLALQLVSAPERYDGALVSFFGWCVNRFEQTTVQLSADRDAWSSAIWLELNEELITSIDASKPTFCRVQGTFRDGWAGHMGRWPGQINPVEDVVIYPEPLEPPLVD